MKHKFLNYLFSKKLKELLPTDVTINCFVVFFNRNTTTLFTAKVVEIIEPANLFLIAQKIIKGNKIIGERNLTLNLKKNKIRYKISFYEEASKEDIERHLAEFYEQHPRFN
jgi:hypothetical protein